MIEGDDGLTVIDTLLTPAMALDFRRMVREVTPKPVRRVILTHFHGDHILGAEVFEGARIIAHENTRRYLEESWDFAGFHIGVCNGSGWIAGRSAAESLRDAPEPRPNSPLRSIRLAHARPAGPWHDPGELISVLTRPEE